MKIDPQLQERIESLHPVNRLGTVEEVAEVVLWLCSDAASFVAGREVPVDGVGHYARSEVLKLTVNTSPLEPVEFE